MQEEYIKHNLFIKGLDAFCQGDPHLSTLKDLKFVHPMDWWKGIDWKNPGIFILTGGRQVGKSTSTKLLIKNVLGDKNFSPQQIFYLPCEMVDNHHHLASIIKLFLEDLPAGNGGRFLLIVDEVTFVKDWDRAIKSLADEGSFRNGFCVLTGSDSVILKEAASRFPGRRGAADLTDFHIYPLNFHEFVGLVEDGLLVDSENKTESILNLFEKYMKSGGYLKAINDLYLYGEIKKATYLTFEQWIRGDFERRNKNAAVLTGVFKTLFETLGTQVTLSALTNRMGQVVKETFIDYVDLLERMDIVFALQALDQNTRLGFPKKARKMHFTDPFIMDTVERWLVAERQISAKDLIPQKAEAIVASNYHRRFPTYYIKADGEIDVAVVTGKSFVPIEIKWTNQVRQQDLKQLLKFRQSLILTKGSSIGRISGVSAIPLPLFLVKFSERLPPDDFLGRISHV